MTPLTPLAPLAQAGTTTTSAFASQLTQDEPSPFSTGGLVFFFVLAVLVIGALVLFLRYRQKAPSARS
jgi:hypothetical protein